MVSDRVPLFRQPILVAMTPGRVAAVRDRCRAAIFWRSITRSRRAAAPSTLEERRHNRIEPDLPLVEVAVDEERRRTRNATVHAPGSRPRLAARGRRKQVLLELIRIEARLLGVVEQRGALEVDLVSAGPRT